MFTKGEWTVYDPKHKGLLVMSSDTLVAEVNNDLQWNEHKDDTYLIAAAPDMYEALKFAMPYIAKMIADEVNTAIPPGQALKRMEQALSKAEGKYNAEYTKEDSIQDAKTMPRWSSKK